MKMCNTIIGGQKNIIFCSVAIMVLLFCAERIAIGAQLTSYVVTSGSNYRSMSNSYGSSSTLRMGQNDVPGGSNRFERGYAVFDLRSLPTDADISQVRLRFDCTWVDTTDPDGVMFYAELGPLTCSKSNWDSYNSEQRWRYSYSNYSGFYSKQLFSTDTYNNVYLYLESTARSRIESKAGDYVVFNFRLATQNEGVPWSGDAYHGDTVVPDWARIDYGWDIYNVTGTIDDDWLATFSDLRLVIDYTVPILPELSNPTMNTFNGNPETDFYYYVDYYQAGDEAPSIKQVYIDNDSGHNMSLVSGSASYGTYRYGPKNLSPGDHTCFFYFMDQSNHKAFSPSSGEWTMPFVSPYKATNPSPSNAATNQSVNVNTSWSNGGGATSYDVYFGTDPTPDSTEYKGNQTGTSYDPGTLAYSATYYWRINAKNSQGTTTGDICHFATTQQAGSLNVIIQPEGARDAGAQWRVDGGPWIDSGYFQHGLSVGQHTVGFKSVSGWNTPSDQTVQIDADETTYVTGTYIPEEPEINIKQGSTDIPDETGNYDFGDTNVDSSKVVTFTIENLGDATLNLSGSPMVVISGTNADEFVVTQNPATPIASSGGKTTFEITFTPWEKGKRTATVFISNDDADENPYNFSIIGTGIGEPTPNPDLNNDGVVNFFDFAILARNWLDKDCNDPNWCEGADLNGDCFVDYEDFALMANQWLTGDPCIPDDMAYIPDGEFEMGDHLGDGQVNELPLHPVLIDSFFMGRYEITNQQYCVYLNSAILAGDIKVVGVIIVFDFNDTGLNYPYCDTHNWSPDSQIDYSGGVFSVRSKGGRDMSNDPMIMVSWYGAAAYCNWRSQQEGKELCYNLSTWNCDFSKKGYRLATEAEWEYAARGGLSGRRFPWGDTISHSQANYWADPCSYLYDINPTRGLHPTWNYTSPVGSFAANGFGLYDMSGNVWEWCNDWYDKNYYDTSPDDNPTGPASGIFSVYRVLRSGSWNLNANSCRLAFRNLSSPDNRGFYCGFRIVLDLN